MAKGSGVTFGSRRIKLLACLSWRLDSKVTQEKCYNRDEQLFIGRRRGLTLKHIAGDMKYA